MVTRIVKSAFLWISATHRPLHHALGIVKNIASMTAQLDEDEILAVPVVTADQ